MRTRILFVDDEAFILSALRRMLHDMTQDWDLAFANNAEEALAAMAAQPFDVVVSDMRMPGMDGAQLLSEVARLYPDSIRFILSGHSDREMISRTVRPTHQFITKPVNGAELKNHIQRGLWLERLSLSGGIKTLVKKVGSLPSVPKVYAALTAMLDDEESSVDGIAELISKDMGISANILKIVNSAYFGQRVKVGSLIHAVNLLGIETIRSLVLYSELVHQFDRKKFPHFNLETLWGHSLSTSRLCKALAATTKAAMDFQNDCYTAGLLHDVGKIVLADNFKEEYARVLARCGTEKRTPWSLEMEVFGTSHAEVGAYLLGLWGLPEPVVEAVYHHHEPGRSGVRELCPLAYVHLANALEHELVVINEGYARNPVDVAFLEQAGCRDKMESWRGLAAEMFTRESADGK